METLKALSLVLILSATLFTGLAIVPTLTDTTSAFAESPNRDSPSDDNQGGGNDPPNNPNHRGVN